MPAATYPATATVPVANGGTGATTAAGARTNLQAAASGANSDITSLFWPGHRLKRGTGRHRRHSRG